MKHVGQILEELGFNKEAPLSTQKAFLKHLEQAAQDLRPVNHVKPEPQPEKNRASQPLQLSFDFDAPNQCPAEKAKSA
ncbi:MAG: hypothetical protein H6626_11550 [Pseudobdellovibrionaceae bacterium]|nr:hypothetical protein [Bdellovibrionales bacterium]USN46829.1 MAG: hypothetical protein H6626_11550 [Pseudobdellovibrionaceae bacterium]